MSSLIAATVTTAVLTVGSKVAGGISAAGTDLSEAKGAAAGVFQDKMNLLSGKKSLSVDAAGQQFTSGSLDLSLAGQTGLRNIQSGSDTSTSKANLATSGTIEQQTKVQTGDLMNRFQSDMQKLMEKRFNP